MKPETMAVLESSRYEKQAQDFLDKFGIKFRATLSDSKVAPWSNGDGESGRHYRCTLSKRVSTGVHGSNCFCMNCSRPNRITFDFFGSIADARSGKHPTPYDVLACISGDVHCAESFEDFCGEFGYEQDSIKALQTYRRVAAFAKRLRAFFTSEEIEALGEIR